MNKPCLDCMYAHLIRPDKKNKNVVYVCCDKHQEIFPVTMCKKECKDFETEGVTI